MPRNAGAQSQPAPYFELRIGSLRVTADRIPARLLTVASTVVTAVVTWHWSR